MNKPLPCPFCGMRPPDDLIDTLYPSGPWWRQDGDGHRSYHLHRNRAPGDQPCVTMHCTENMGGCGAEITADTEAEVIAKWNRRAPMPDTGCAECGKTSTRDSMWALYCVGCIQDKIAPALASEQPPCPPSP